MKKNIYKNESLSKYNWFNLGGPAEIFFKPNNEIEIKEFLKSQFKETKKIHILGAGSNTLFRDKGFDGIIIKLNKNFAYTKLLEDNKIEAGAATLDKHVSDFATEKSLSGFEFLSCIPGSIGGAITMNSGCYGEDISKIVFSLKVMDLNGEIKILNKDQIKFFYRGTSLNKNFIILSVVLLGKKSSKQIIRSKVENLINKKKNSQPSRIKTCGSTFKNPINQKAWQLIKLSNCKDLKIGGAKISPQHCNFFLNDGNATSSDIENLIQKVKSEVLEKTGVNLELELKIVGRK
tara:strand:+ start:875 stop:1747 length:873 start_codon:yes stop_codon:yes gene_type:complete